MEHKTMSDKSIIMIEKIMKIHMEFSIFHLF